MTPTKRAGLKVFVAGATGALGSQLIPQLIEAGHEVIGMTRTESKAGRVRALGAVPVIADALDPVAVGRAVSEAEPDAIVHELTALTDLSSFRNIDKAFEMTNRLRTEGTDNLLSAGRAAGIEKFVIQSFAGWPFAKTGGPVKSEEDPLDPNPPKKMAGTLAAIEYLEREVSGVNDQGWAIGTVLRYGGFYGPGTSLSSDPESAQTQMILGRRWPLVGEGNGITSFIHISDAAAATVRALDGDHPGIYNVVDDEPAPFSEWMPVFAETVGARPPRRVPKWVGRLAGGEVAVGMMTEMRGASNAKAKRELGWEPRYASWRQGFAEGLG
jgi:nucleoside-diphosphate-sugar epimerase